MPDYDNTNRGVMFKNDRKDSPSHPDYKGSLDVEGQSYWISGWIKTAGPNSRNPGSKFLSVSIQAKDGDGGFSKPAPTPARNPTPVFDDDDDIPF